MAKILILYGSTEGQTARIAEHIAKTLKARNHEVEMKSGEHLPAAFSLNDFDAVVVGASVHYGKHQKYVRKFIGRHLDTLGRKPSAFFSVSAAAGSPRTQDHAGVERLVNRFIEETDWRPDRTVIFGGAVVYTQYGFFKRLMMKMILKSAGGPTDTSRDHEFTDWDAVTRFAEEFAAGLPCGRKTSLTGR